MKHTKRRKHMAARVRANRSAWRERVGQDAMAYAWHRKNLGTGDGLMHPGDWRRWLEKGPCPGCSCQEWCDRICHLRARWWDDHMERLRKQLGTK